MWSHYEVVVVSVGYLNKGSGGGRRGVESQSIYAAGNATYVYVRTPTDSGE